MKSIKQTMKSIIDHPHLDAIVIQYLKPLETPDAILVLKSPFATLNDWILSRQKTTTDSNGRVETRVDGILHAADENQPTLIVPTGKMLQYHRHGILCFIKWDNGSQLNVIKLAEAICSK